MADSDLELRIAWQQHVGRSRAAHAHLESVVNRYRETHRRYHDVRHLRWVVRHVDRFAKSQPVADAGAVTVAAFYHDAIYDPVAADNEQASARLAADVLESLDWSSDRIEIVTAMILGTVNHRWQAASSVDQTVLYAADLGVLAADPAGYSAYVRNVRKEYGHVTDDDWAMGRSDVLRSFLDRDAIYAPSLGLTDWELRARGNLTAELDQLGPSGS